MNQFRAMQMNHDIKGIEEMIFRGCRSVQDRSPVFAVRIAKSRGRLS